MLSGTEINLLNLHLTPKYQQTRRQKNDLMWHKVCKFPSRREIRAFAVSKYPQNTSIPPPCLHASRCFSPSTLIHTCKSKESGFFFHGELQQCGQLVLHINIPGTLGEFQPQRPVLEMKLSRFKCPTSGKSSQAANQPAPKMAFPSRSAAAFHTE